VASVNETVGQQGTPLNAALVAGIEDISYHGEVEFVRYVRLILPIDGFAFWVKADLVNPSAYPKAVEVPYSIKAQGSFHYATDVAQEETETNSSNTVVFTSESEVQDLNSVDPQSMYIGTFNGVRFAFSSRQSFYKVADIYHYVGHGLYATMATQIIDDPADIDDRQVVSNSLPFWLAMNTYVKRPYEDFAFPDITLYPSYLVPQNAALPYGTVHVESTTALASTPNLNSTNSHSQLMTDKVWVTLYGLRHSEAMDFVDFVNQYSVNRDLLGIMNMPAVRDDKRTQVEFNILAQRKSVDYEVSYYQALARDMARQLIKIVIVNYYNLAP
jgi:hypothetical protein